MSIARSQARSKPISTRKTVVLFDSTTPRHMPSFGRGLDDEPRMSIADLVAAWEMAQDDDYDWDEDDHYDTLAAESATQDRAERGFFGGDLAEYLSSTSLVGHRP